VSRNENIFKLKLEALYGNFTGVIDVDFVWRGYPEALEAVGDLARRNLVDPYYIQAHAAYVEAVDFLVEGLDLRVGQQLVLWGKGDQFNPTNNLNANDVEDILLFGEQLANLMARLDYAFGDMWSVSAVLVPVFKPALLPNTATLGLSALDRAPFLDSGLRHRVHFEKALSTASGLPTVATRVEPLLPDTSLGNMQFAIRLAGTLFGQDMALSYYNGRSDIPQPILNHTTQLDGQLCNPADETGGDCIDGLLQTEAQLGYPEVQVIGFNLAGEIPLSWLSNSLHGVGYRLELGVYLPEKTAITLTQGDLEVGGFPYPAGEYDYDGDGEPGGPNPLVLDSTPFLKWTLGLDYSFGRHVMATLMWVHGFADEFGAGDFLSEGYVVRRGGVAGATGEDPMVCLLEEIGQGATIVAATRNCGGRSATEILRPRIGDYVVMGVDVRFDDEKGLLRFFGIWDISGYFEDRWDEQLERPRRVRRYLSLFGDGFSAILYPEFSYNFGNGLELGFGALLQLGKSYTKFGDPAAGGSLVFTRARFSY
jgi:hypothetical protein